MSYSRRISDDIHFVSTDQNALLTEVHENSKDSHVIKRWIQNILPKFNPTEIFIRPITLKIAVLGDSGVGKTCLVKTFTSGIKNVNSPTTIGYDLHSRVIEVECQRVKLNIWEPSGQERFHDAIPRQCLRDCHAVIFCYDPTHYKSLVNICQVWKEMVSRHVKWEDCPRILVECKTDLTGCECPEKGSFCRHILPSEREVALNLLGLEMFSTSVMTSSEDQLEAPFRYLARRILKDDLLLEEIMEDANNRETVELNNNYDSNNNSEEKEKTSWWDQITKLC